MLEYIMHAFPKVYEFIMIAGDSSQISTKIPNSTWVQFLVHLYNTYTKLQARDLCIGADVPGVLARFFDTKKNVKMFQVVLHAHNDNNSYNKIRVDVDSWLQRPDKSEQEFRLFLTTAFVTTQPQGNAPQLFDLMSKVGGFLHQIKIDTSFPNSNGPKCLTDFFLDHVFQHCPDMDFVELSNLALIKHSPDPQTYTLIKEIWMYNCGHSLGFFPELSVRLPSLSTLWLMNHHCLGPAGKTFEKTRRERYNCIIKTPHTYFKTLGWHRNLMSHTTGVNVKIVTSTKSYYYVCNEYGRVTESTDVSYQMSLDNRHVFSMYIQCRGILKLIITFGSFTWVLTELE